MTNYDKWRLFTSGLVSPDNYIDFGFYYLIGAALQRRVWLGAAHAPIFPNSYAILVGEPAIGKGLVIKPVASILRYHHLPDPTLKQANPNVSAEEAVQESVTAAENFNRATDGGKLKEKPLLIPVAADATTYEALVRALSKSLRHINYRAYDEKLMRDIVKVYTHSSMCFCLEEISSLFKQRAVEVVHFLLQTYDCGDYEYDTKTQGKDKVQRCCVNLFGGTTPAFLRKIFDDSLLTEGFASRTWFIFATENRFTRFFVPPLTPEQTKAYFEIIEWVEKLTHLYGQVQISEETNEFLESWLKESMVSRPNTNPKLNPYYGRKNQHIAKLAMALHFGENLDMFIPQATFEKAIEILASEEKNMHFALGIDNANPLAEPMRKIIAFIRQTGPKTFKELYAEFYEALPEAEKSLQNIISHAKALNKIVAREEIINGTKVIKYCVISTKE